MGAAVSKDLFAQLREPFPASDIEWRVQQAGAGNKGPWARVLAYVTNRAIMQRLDDVVGPQNWRNEYATGPHGGLLCGLSIRVGDEWITKWDGADNTQVEAVKGGLSGAMKRAAVQWGIGRYLYDLPEGWADIHDKGANYQGPNNQKNTPAFKWDPPDLPAWALPGGSGKPDAPQPKPASQPSQAPRQQTGQKAGQQIQPANHLATPESLNTVREYFGQLGFPDDHAVHLDETNKWLGVMKRPAIEHMQALPEAQVPHLISHLKQRLRTQQASK